MISHAQRDKAILQDQGHQLGTNEENEAKLKRFLDVNQYNGPKDIVSIVNWYDDLKDNYMKRVLFEQAVIH